MTMFEAIGGPLGNPGNAEADDVEMSTGDGTCGANCLNLLSVLSLFWPTFIFISVTMSPGLRSFRPKPTLLLGGALEGLFEGLGWGLNGGLETLKGGNGWFVVDVVEVVVVVGGGGVDTVVVVRGPHDRSENHNYLETASNYGGKGKF